MAEKDLIPVNKRTKEEAKRISVKGGKRSGVARRGKRDLNKRLKIALEFLGKEKSKSLKKAEQIEKSELVKEIGLEVYSFLEIATDNLVDEKVRVSVWKDVMDRLGGKPVQKNIIDATVNECKELTDKEKELIDRQIEKQAAKLKK